MSQDTRLPLLLRLVAALYPRSFRQIYGEGFVALLECERKTPFLFLDLFIGALDAHLQALRGNRSLPAFIWRLTMRTAMNTIYALVAFPLGLAYFLLLIGGVSFGVELIVRRVVIESGLPTIAGLSLLVAVMALPVLALTSGGVRLAARFERWLTATALEVQLPSVSTRPLRQSISLEGLNLSPRGVRSFIFSKETLKSAAYLFVKFPFGIASFSATIFFGSTGVVLLSAPIAYKLVDYDFQTLGATWSVHSFGDAIWPAFVGLLFLTAAIITVNLFAAAWGLIARALLVEAQSPNQTLELDS